MTTTLIVKGETGAGTPNQRKRAKAVFDAEPYIDHVFIVPRKAENYEWPKPGYNGAVLQDGKGVVDRGTWAAHRYKAEIIRRNAEIMADTEELAERVFEAFELYDIAETWAVDPAARMVDTVFGEPAPGSISDR